MAGIARAFEFEDLLPVMAEKLGGEGLINELCNGFELLMDKEKGLITLDSLRRNSAVLGLQDLREDELESMVKEGDLDGDGALNQMEFCVLMFRLSPDLMDESWFWLQHALQQEIATSSWSIRTLLWKLHYDNVNNDVVLNFYFTSFFFFGIASLFIMN